MKIPDNIKRKFYFVINLIGVLFIIYFVLAVFYFDVDENSEASDSEKEDISDQLTSTLFVQIPSDKEDSDFNEELEKNNRFENCKLKDYQSELLKNQEQLLAKLNEDPNLDESLALSIIFEKDNLELLISLRDKYPDNKFIMWNILQACANNAYLKCDNSIIEDAKLLDAQNGAVWMMIASIYAGNEDLDSTNDALIKIYSSPVFNDYYKSKVFLLDNTLNNLGVTTSTDRFAFVITQNSIAPIQYLLNILKFCKNVSVDKYDTNVRCRETGSYLINYSNSFYKKHSGIYLLRIIEEKIGNKTSSVENINIDRINDLVRLSLHDENLANFWLESLKNHGEIEASHRAIEEVERLASDPDYNPCPASVD